MTANSFTKLCYSAGSYVKFDVVPYRSLYPDASEKEFMTMYVDLMYCVLYIQCVPKKTKPTIFITASSTVTVRFNFWQRDNYESAYVYVFDFTCLMLIPGKMFQTS